MSLEHRGADLFLAYRERALELMGECGTYQALAKRLGISVMALWEWRRKDPAWADELQERINTVWRDRLEHRVDERATEGYIDPTGQYRPSSDILLMFRLKRLDPSYRDNPPPTQIDARQQSITIIQVPARDNLPTPGDDTPRLIEG